MTTLPAKTLPFTTATLAFCTLAVTQSAGWAQINDPTQLTPSTATSPAVVDGAEVYQDWRGQAIAYRALMKTLDSNDRMAFSGLNISDEKAKTIRSVLAGANAKIEPLEAGFNRTYRDSHGRVFAPESGTMEERAAALRKAEHDLATKEAAIVEAAVAELRSKLGDEFVPIDHYTYDTFGPPHPHGEYPAGSQN